MEISTGDTTITTAPTTTGLTALQIEPQICPHGLYIPLCTDACVIQHILPLGDPSNGECGTSG